MRNDDGCGRSARKIKRDSLNCTQLTVGVYDTLQTLNWFLDNDDNNIAKLVRTYTINKKRKKKKLLCMNVKDHGTKIILSKPGI